MGVRGVGGVRGVLRRWQDYRYSGARRGIEGIRGYWGAARMCGVLGTLEALGVSGVYWGTGRDSRYSGARRHTEGIRVYWAAGKRCSGC